MRRRVRTRLLPPPSSPTVPGISWRRATSAELAGFGPFEFSLWPCPCRRDAGLLTLSLLGQFLFSAAFKCPTPMQSLPIVCARPNVGPQLVEFVGTDDALPCRHLAPASHNHLIETRPSISLLLLQIGNCSSASELRAMTSCAVFFVDLLAGLDPVLRRCIGAGAKHDTGRGACKEYLTHRWPLSSGDGLPVKPAFDLVFHPNVSHPPQSGDQIKFGRRR